MSAIDKPGRYAVDADGRLYTCRGRWRARAVAVIVVRRKLDARPMGFADIVLPRPVVSMPYVPGKKISLAGAPSGMEALADSWRRGEQTIGEAANRVVDRARGAL